MRTTILTGSALIAFNLLFLASCGGGDKKVEKVDSLSSIEIENKALSLMSNNCFVCHNPDMESETRIAPPMFKIREHYFDEKTSREEFIKEIVAFALDPSEELSIMPGAVRNFGLMPKTPFNEKDLILIAGYIYDNDLASDEWDEKWEKFQKNTGNKTSDLNYLELGRSIANQTKAELGKNLMAAVKKNGPAGAVDFCNTRAIKLTDSMGVVLNAKVKRVSDRPRNPSNIANADENAYILALISAREKGETLSPKASEVNGKMLGYYAIETNELCLKCHGIPNKTITPETLKMINKHYPTDKAVGYKENEIRGIFVVEMSKK